MVFLVHIKYGLNGFRLFDFIFHAIYFNFCIHSINHSQHVVRVFASVSYSLNWVAFHIKSTVPLPYCHIVSVFFNDLLFELHFFPIHSSNSHSVCFSICLLYTIIHYLLATSFTFSIFFCQFHQTAVFLLRHKSTNCYKMHFIIMFSKSKLHKLIRLMVECMHNAHIAMRTYKIET